MVWVSRASKATPVKTLSYILRAFALVILSLSITNVVSCSDTELVEFNGKRGVQTKRKKRDRPTEVDSGNKKDRNTSEKLATDIEEEEIDITEVEDEQEEVEVCSEVGEVNVVLVFDNSSSQSNRDLESMRNGANILANRLTALSSARPFETHASVVRFSSSASIGSNRWVNMAGAGNTALSADIVQATSDDSGQTYYESALVQVENLFIERSAGVEGAQKRNFVVFLSDGRPDDEDRVDVVARRLVDSYNAAFLTIATGANNIEALEDLAAMSGFNYPVGHRGSFYQAEDQDAVVTVFDQVFAVLDSVCP